MQPGPILSIPRPTRRKFAAFAFRTDYDDAVQGNYNLVLHPEDDTRGTKHIVQRQVPEEILRPPYATEGHNVSTELKSTEIGEAIYPLKSIEEQYIRAAGKLASSALKYISTFIKPGATPDFLDRRLHQWIVDHDCYPSTLNYQGFPRSCCVSVNNIIAHGIPDHRPLEETDMLTLDLTLYTRTGYHSDTSRTFCLQPREATASDSYAFTLEEITRHALHSAIAVCGPGVPFREIGRVIEQTVEKESSGMMSIVKQLTGHGVGKSFHMRPWILPFANCEPGEMRPGHCFTIEPCLVQGLNPRGWIFPDGWTASTENCARSAQKEHMVLITERGAEVIT